jgi:hypothetical protein
MKKLEIAPNWFEKQLLDKALDIRSNNIDLEEIIHKMNNPYLYWDKLKYKSPSVEIPNDLLWTLTKLSRIYAKKISLGQFHFKFNITDTIQKG